jgi:hypothetical protein
VDVVAGAIEFWDGSTWRLERGSALSAAQSANHATSANAAAWDHIVARGRSSPGNVARAATAWVRASGFVIALHAGIIASNGIHIPPADAVGTTGAWRERAANRRSGIDSSSDRVCVESSFADPIDSHTECFDCATAYTRSATGSGWRDDSVARDHPAVCHQSAARGRLACDDGANCGEPATRSDAGGAFIGHSITSGVTAVTGFRAHSKRRAAPRTARRRETRGTRRRA